MNRVKRTLTLLLVTVVLCSGVFFPAEAEAKTAQSDKVLRVGLMLQYGFCDLDDQGQITGYTYEYLMRLSQRVGWKYDFVVFEVNSNEDMIKPLDMLKNGELDLMGAMVYNESTAAEYEFCMVPYGYSNYVLLAREDNDTLSPRTFERTKNVRVAVSKNSPVQNEQFEAYCKRNNRDFTRVYTETYQEARELVINGEADVFIGKDVTKNTGYKAVLRFAEQPFYFAAAKGNTALTDQLDALIADMNSTAPSFMEELHERFFTTESERQISMTQEERAFVQNAPSIKIAITKNQYPLQDIDSNGDARGVLVDILELMAKSSGLKFQYVAARSAEEAETLVRNGTVDLVAGVPYSYNVASDMGVILTSPVLSLPVMRVDNKQGRGNEGTSLVSSSIRTFKTTENVEYIEDTKSLLSQINSGVYASGYISGYMISGRDMQDLYPNVVVSPIQFGSSDLSLGLSENSDLNIMSILEQSIAKLSGNDIRDIVYENTLHAQELGFWETVARNPLLIIIPVCAILLVGVLFLVVLVVRTKKMNRIVSGERQRFSAIAKLDQMTGTYNNETFKKLAKEFISGDGCPVKGTLIVCDIDDFKSINDSLGHFMGDEVLVNLGKVFLGLSRETDMVGRLGGDEFMILMRDVDSRALAQRRCLELQAKARSITDRCQVSLSIGCVLFRGAGSFEELFKAADEALYTVKKRGKNGYEIVELRKPQPPSGEEQSI